MFFKNCKKAMFTFEAGKLILPTSPSPCHALEQETSCVGANQSKRWKGVLIRRQEGRTLKVKKGGSL